MVGVNKMNFDPDNKIKDKHGNIDLLTYLQGVVVSASTMNPINQVPPS